MIFLKVNSLNVEEVDLLRACSKWIDAEIGRQMLEATSENKRKLFGPLKCLIDFSEMNITEVGKMGDELRNLLDDNEALPLFFHLCDKSVPLIFNCRTLKREQKKSICSNTFRNEKKKRKWY